MTASGEAKGVLPMAAAGVASKYRPVDLMIPRAVVYHKDHTVLDFPMDVTAYVWHDRGWTDVCFYNGRGKHGDCDTRAAIFAAQNGVQVSVLRDNRKGMAVVRLPYAMVVKDRRE